MKVLKKSDDVRANKTIFMCIYICDFIDIKGVYFISVPGKVFADLMFRRLQHERFHCQLAL